MDEKIKEMVRKMCFVCSSTNTEIVGRNLKCRGCGGEFLIDNGEKPIWRRENDIL